MQFKGSISLFVANCLFGVNFLLFKQLTGHDISPYLLFVILTTVNFLIFLPSLFTKEAYKLTFHEIKIIFFTTIIIIYGKEYFLIKGAMLSNPINASTIATLSPIITLSLSSIMFKENLHKSKIIGILLCFIGSSIMFIDNIDFSSSKGNYFILISVLASACNTVFLKRTLNVHSSRIVMAWSYLFGMIITIPIFYKYLNFSELVNLSDKAFSELLFLSLPGTALPTILLYFGVKTLTSVHTALYSYMQPITAIILGMMIFNISLDFANKSALIIIFIGVILVSHSYKKYGFKID